MLLRRIALLYAVLMLCRVIFYLYNAQLLGPLSWGELGQLLAGSLKFDTASVVYADGVFVLLSLLPLHARERKWYRRLLFWYYAVVKRRAGRGGQYGSTASISATRRSGSPPMKYSSPTTATRCSWSANSWPKTGIWSSRRRP